MPGTSLLATSKFNTVNLPHDISHTAPNSEKLPDLVLVGYRTAKN